MNPAVPLTFATPTVHSLLVLLSRARKLKLALGSNAIKFLNAKEKNGVQKKQVEDKPAVGTANTGYPVPKGRPVVAQRIKSASEVLGGGKESISSTCPCRKRLHLIIATFGGGIRGAPSQVPT